MTFDDPHSLLLCRTKLCRLVRHWRLRVLFLPRDGRRVHQLRQERILARGARLQEGQRRQEHLVAELGHFPQGPSQLLHTGRVSLLLQRNTYVFFLLLLCRLVLFKMTLFFFFLVISSYISFLFVRKRKEVGRLYVVWYFFPHHKRQRKCRDGSAPLVSFFKRLFFFLLLFLSSIPRDSFMLDSYPYGVHSRIYRQRLFSPYSANDHGRNRGVLITRWAPAVLFHLSDGRRVAFSSFSLKRATRRLVSMEMRQSMSAAVPKRLHWW